MTQANPFQNNNAPKPPSSSNTPIDEFEIMRQRLKRRGATTGMERQADLSRQFAALGNLPSGAALKARQNTAQAQELATNEALQDVNVLQAQTQRAERESGAERELKRELQTQLVGSQEREGLANRQVQERVAQLAATTDLEKARMAGANAIELQTLANDARMKEVQFVEKGMDARLAKQLAESRNMFDLEMKFNEEGRSITTELAERGLSIQQQEFEINKTVSALNSMDLLFSIGFNNAEIGNLVEALNLPFQDKLLPFLAERYQRYDAPPAPRAVRPGASTRPETAEERAIRTGGR